MKFDVNSFDNETLLYLNEKSAFLSKNFNSINDRLNSLVTDVYSLLTKHGLNSSDDTEYMQDTLKKYFSDCEIFKCENKYKYEFVCKLLYFFKKENMNEEIFFPLYNSHKTQNNIEEHPLSWYDVYNIFEKPFYPFLKKSL